MRTLLWFKAPWCAPCMAMQPIMDELKAEYANDIIFSEINIEDNPQLRADYGIRSIPAFVLMQLNKEVGRKIGSGTLTEMQEWLNEPGAL